MAGIAAPSLLTYHISITAENARNAEYTGTPLTDVTGDGTFAVPYLGCNRGGSNACGIGIATGIVAANSVLDLRPESWTLEDQFEVARIPQFSQHIGGIDDAAPAYDGTQYPSSAEVGFTPVKTIVGADINDVMNFVIADTAAADGAIADTVTGTINDTGATIAIGDVLWGKQPIA